MTTLNAADDGFVRDTDTLAVNNFKEEGAFLLLAQLSSAALTKRIAATDRRVKVFRISRDELETLAYQFKRAVVIASECHIAESETAQ